MEPTVVLHLFGGRLLLAGCLLLGAGFFIKLDTTGPRGKFLDCKEGLLALLSRE